MLLIEAGRLKAGLFWAESIWWVVGWTIGWWVVWWLRWGESLHATSLHRKTTSIWNHALPFLAFLPTLPQCNKTCCGTLSPFNFLGQLANPIHNMLNCVFPWEKKPPKLVFLGQLLGSFDVSNMPFHISFASYEIIIMLYPASSLVLFGRQAYDAFSPL